MAEQGEGGPWGAHGVNTHPDARELLLQFAAQEPAAFYDDPQPAGLLLAEDVQSYVMRVGALLGAQKITEHQAAALVRGLGVTLLNPDENERSGAPR